MADYTRVIEQLPGAPIDQVALALNNRGSSWDRKGDREKAVADYTRVIEQLPGAPVDQVAQALTNRGWMHYMMNDNVAFLSDTESALIKQARGVAAHNLGLGLLALGRDADALAAYRVAGETFAESIDVGMVDLREARQKWLTPERAEPVLQLLESLKD